MVSGSYSPGDLYFFRGLGPGRFAPAAKLRSVDGKHANAGRASAVSVVDWDRDGDLDLVVGSSDGEVDWLANEGNRDGAPVFAKPPKFVVEVPGGDAGPCVVDWNGDGKEDLLLGSARGAVWFVSDMRTARGAALRSTKPLIGDSASISEETRPSVVRDESTGAWAPVVDRPQIRAKPTACDWNGDGLLDLLVGDYTSGRSPEPTLTAEEKSEKIRLEDERRTASNRLSTLSARILERARVENGILDHRPAKEEELEEKIQARARELEAGDADHPRLRAAVEKLEARIGELSSQSFSHGYVWVYLRRADVLK